MTARPPDNHYLHPRLAAVYKASEKPYPLEEAFYLGLAGQPPKRVLDIGCGVGTFAVEFHRRGHEVTGYDPAPAMLDVARSRADGDKITWVEGCAETLDLGTTFDLIIMTGHAFQVLVSDEEIKSALAAMARHLAPGGRLAFETRNPVIKWEELWAARAPSDWVTERGDQVNINTLVHERGETTIRFEHVYTFADEVLTSESLLRFTERAEVEGLLGLAGLAVEALYGDWDQSPFDPEASPEMIFVASRD